MAKLITLGSAVDATAVAAQTAQSTTSTPFGEGFNAIVHVCSTGLTGSPVIKVQTSDDNSSWTDAVTVNVLTRNHVMSEVTLKKYARLNVTTGGSAGRIDAYITE